MVSQQTLYLREFMRKNVFCGIISMYNVNNKRV